MCTWDDIAMYVLAKHYGSLLCVKWIRERRSDSNMILYGPINYDRQTLILRWTKKKLSNTLGEVA